MVKYRALAVDLDHTLLTPTGTVSAVNRQALAKAAAAGWTLAIASGRRQDSIVEVIAALDLPIYGVCLNGAYVITPDRQVIAQAPMTRENVLALFDLAADTGVNITLNGARQTYFYPGRTRLDIPEYITKSTTTTLIATRQEVCDLVAQTTIFKLAYNAPAHTLLARLGRAAARWATPVWSDTTYLEMSATNTTKLSGLATVAAEQGLMLDQFVACGDYENDRTMLAGVGLGIAMDNALPSIKAIADRVVDNHAYTGVGLAINQILRKDE